MFINGEEGGREKRKKRNERKRKGRGINTE